MAILSGNLIKSFSKIKYLSGVLYKNGCISRFSSSDTKVGSPKGLVIGLYENTDETKFSPSGEKFNKCSGGKVMELVKEYNMSGALGQSMVFNNLDDKFRSVAVVGVGKEDLGYNEFEAIEEGLENVRVASAVGAKKLYEQGCQQISIDCMNYPEQAAEGSALALWNWQGNRINEDKDSIPKLDALESSDIQSWNRGLYLAESQNLARRLSDTPSNEMTPTAFAQAALDLLCPCNVKVEIRQKDWIETNELNSFLAVAKGTREPPIFIEMKYSGTSEEKDPILLVGKGLTFNSGGICLKKKDGMDEYRASMAGAAVIVAAMKAAAELLMPINLVAVVPLCENMASGMALKPGDVITCMNKKTLAVHDTDNAGVVMLADTLLYAQTTYKPSIVIDVATISAGVQKGIGASATGVFSNSDFLWKHLFQAGTITGDRMWRMPLWDYYTRKVTDYLSFDVSNKGHGPATSCLSAAVLKEFVLCQQWAHLDITGVGMLEKSHVIPYLTPEKMTGRPTRTLIQFLHQMACAEK